MCGIFGVYDARKAAELCVVGLHNNNHRANDYAGIVTTDGYTLFGERGAGLAWDVFSDINVLNRLHGRHALGHVRYPTVVDNKKYINIQPIEGNYGGTDFALAHNGNLTNRKELEVILGEPMATSMDTELIVRLIKRFHTGDLIGDLSKVFGLLRGSYALGILFPDRLIAVQDPSSCRPLSLGKRGRSYFISSETSGFDGVEAHYLRDIRAGEILCISAEGLLSFSFAEAKLKKCRFEGNYFSHPTSLTFGEPVNDYRERLGRALEKRHPAIGADIVVPVPDSAIWIAKGYAESGRSGVYNMAIVRNHNTRRSFIAASQAKIDEELARKFNFTPHAIRGKKVVVVDDSIVRGNTLPKIVSRLRFYDAKEVHVRIGSPPIFYPCLYGINTPNQKKLISANMTKERICEKAGADSLEFLPLEIQKQMSPNPESFCFACMDGERWDQ